jgi:hypothetical protein
MVALSHPVHLPSIALDSEINAGLLTTQGIITTAHLGQNDSDGLGSQALNGGTLGTKTPSIAFTELLGGQGLGVKLLNEVVGVSDGDGIGKLPKGRGRS